MEVYVEKMRSILAHCQFKIATRDEFDALELKRRLPTGLHNRAKEYIGTFVIYDPEDDEDGWLLIGDDLDAMIIESGERLLNLS